MSYLIDLSRGHIKGRPSFLTSGLYVALFPQLIAGPIIRFQEIADQFEQRSHSFEQFAAGVERFLIGLAKKMLLANILGGFSDYVFGLPSEFRSFEIAWLGIWAYTLQIYFDFSGYSDMAIGIGKMFGFHFPENFRSPYTARSIREFWQRWHITLSTWFRDYLYIPLGGNRFGEVITARNLWIVFILCGMWHGASWNFLLWGVFHGFFLVLERLWLGRKLEILPGIFQRAYCIIVVTLLWIPFRAVSLDDTIVFLKDLLPHGGLFGDASIPTQLKNETVLAFIVGSWISLIPVKNFPHQLKPILKLVLFSFFYLFSLMKIASGSFDPFIYFRF